MERAELARLLGRTVEDSAAAAATVVCESDPERFMSAFAAAVASGALVFVGDPAWGQVEKEQADAIVAAAHRRGPDGDDSGRGWLLIPSGGTSGRLKFARHDSHTIGAAVAGFVRHFGLSQVHAVNVLPLNHVSGMMAWLRTLITGGTFQPWSWTRLQAGERPELSADPWVISLVPTQLERLLRDPAAVAWLRQFAVIFLGGGPVWPNLAERAAAARLPIALSYGMTETAAMVTALRPSEFLGGARSSGQALPHVRLAIDQEGRVRIEGESVFRGYWPGWSDERMFVTEDLGRIDECGELHLLGRRDAMILTGGKKVQPADVEAALHASGEFDDVVVLGVPHPEWGEIVVACYPSKSTDRAPDGALAAARLAAYQRPKRYFALDPWPRTATGKVNRAMLREAVMTRLALEVADSDAHPEV